MSYWKDDLIYNSEESETEYDFNDESSDESLDDDDYIYDFKECVCCICGKKDVIVY